MSNIKRTFKQWLDTCPVVEYHNLKWVDYNVNNILDVYTIDFAIKQEDTEKQLNFDDALKYEKNLSKPIKKCPKCECIVDVYYPKEKERE